MPDPQLIRVRKYPNRRLYDATRSRHLTHEELYELVVAGHTVSVTDSRTGADITNLVLIQAMLERSPEKLSAFPSEFSHLLLRASEQMIRSAAYGWMMQLMRSLAPVAGLGFPLASASPPTTDRSRDEVPELKRRVEDLLREVEALKSSRPSGGSRSRPSRRS